MFLRFNFGKWIFETHCSYSSLILDSISLAQHSEAGFGCGTRDVPSKKQKGLTQSCILYLIFLFK
jgi:hypothetical protein